VITANTVTPLKDENNTDSSTSSYRKS